MRALAVRLRAEARASWRAWLGLALLLGLAGGAAIAAAAGARRTDSAYPRLLEWSRAAHFMTGGGPESIDLQEAFSAIRARPEVADTATSVVLTLRMKVPVGGGRIETIDLPEALAVTDPEGELGVRFNRPKLLAGRMPDPRVAEEVAVPFVLADRYQIEVGETITLVLGNPFGEPHSEVPVRVVGIHAAPSEFPGIGILSVPTVWASPAIHAAHRDLMPPPQSSDANALHVRLHDERSGLASFRAWLEGSPYRELDIPLVQRDQAAGVQRSMTLYAVTLWVAAALIALTGAAVYGQAVSRQLFLDSRDHPALRALGMDRAQLIALSLARATVVGGVAVIVAVALALSLSPLFPVGFARAAEVAPGFAVDRFAVSLGGAAVLVVAVGAALWPALRWAAPGRAVSSARVSAVASAAQRWGVPPVPVTGLRLALEPGRGPTAVPVRSTVAGVTIATAALTAAIVIAASFDHLVSTPALGGHTYDAIVTVDDPDDQEADAEKEVVGAHPAIAEVGEGTVTGGRIGGVAAFGLVFAESQAIGFAIIEGRAPTDTLQRGRVEAALGVRTMRRLRLRIGDDVAIVMEQRDHVRGEVRAIVVGTVAVPVFPFAATQPGEGFALSLGAMERISPGEGGCCFVRFRPGVDRDAVLDGFARKGYFAIPTVARTDLVTLEQISAAPLALAAVFALIAVAVLTHALLTAIRRRRRDLAILKTLGFLRRQARAAVAWQATATVVLCLALAIPAGIAAGRWGWRFFAYGFGVVPEPVVPTAFMVLVIPVTILVANVIAVGPARAAARTQPALVLRAPD